MELVVLPPIHTSITFNYLQLPSLIIPSYPNLTQILNIKIPDYMENRSRSNIQLLNYSITLYIRRSSPPALPIATSPSLQLHGFFLQTALFLLLLLLLVNYSRYSSTFGSIDFCLVLLPTIHIIFWDLPLSPAAPTSFPPTPPITTDIFTKFTFTTQKTSEFLPWTDKSCDFTKYNSCRWWLGSGT